MSSTIRIKRSSVRGKVPNTTNISTGELALNLADKRLYTSNGSSTFEIGSNPDSLSVGSGGFTIANGAITFPTSAGSTDQVLTIDGSGNLSFTTQVLSGASISLEPVKLGDITTNGSSSYSLTYANSSPYTPTYQNGLLVSLNGVIQEPGTSFTVSGSTITFDQALLSSDVIDFILDYTASGTIVVANNELVANNFVGDGSQLTGLNYNNISNAPNVGQYLQVANAVSTYATISTVNSNLANTNAYIASTQGNIDTLEGTVNANLANTNAYIATKLDTSTASATYVTKTDAVASNSSILTLIDDRLQVANAVSTYATISNVNANLANTNAYIASTQGNIDTLESTVNSNLANTNAYIATTQSNINTLESTVNANLANTNAYIATKLDSSTASSTYTTKVDAVASNNALLSLINDRMQVANVSSLISAEVAALVDSAPTTLDTLNELAAALGDDANFSTTITTSLGTKAANSYVNTQLALKTDSTSFNAFVANTNSYIATKADTSSLDAYLQVANANFVTQSTLDNYLQVANGVSVTTYNSNRLDAISVANGVLSYALTRDAVRYVPGSSHALLVSLNGVIQKPVTDYSVAGSTITFTSALVTGQDVVDFIVDSGASAGAPTLPTVNVLDSITTVDGQATYTLLSSNVQHTPSDVNNLRVSVNGIVQEPTADFTVSGNTITFIPALVTNDVVDYVVDHGFAYSVSPIAAPTTLDAITVVNGQATYNLQLHESSYYPVSANHLLVSKNGIVQEPGTDFTVSDATITFIPALVTNDVINYVTDLGATVSPSDLVTRDLLSVELSNVSGGSVDLSGYLQVANSTSFATTSSLDNYLQVANAAAVATSGSFNDLIDTPYANTIGSGSYSSTKYILNGTTTSNTEIELFKLGTSSRISVTSNTTLFYDISFAARRTDAAGESASWQLKGCIDNFSGTVADVGDIYEIAVAQDDITWAVDARADSGNTALGIYARGATGKTVKWTALVETVEVKQ